MLQGQIAHERASWISCILKEHLVLPIELAACYTLGRSVAFGFGLLSTNTLHLSATLPNLYCAQLILPSLSVHILIPRSSAAAPAPTNRGSRWSKLGCAYLASGRLKSSIILCSRSEARAVTASINASSKLVVYGKGVGLPKVRCRSRRL